MDHNMHRLLCTGFVLKRKINEDLKQVEIKSQQEIQEIDAQLQIMKEKPMKKQKTSIDDFVARSIMEQKMQALLQQRSMVQKEPMSLHRKLTQLIPDHVASLVILSNSKLRNKTELFTRDAHRCPKCGRLFLFDAMTHLNHCDGCKIVTRSLFVLEDKQTEVISFVNQKQPLLQQNQSLLDQHPSVFKTNRSASDRVKMYREYLSQFLDNAPVIPQFVLDSLYMHFQNIHVLNSWKCNLSSVEKHLVSDPELEAYASMSVRILKLFSGHACPVIPTELYDVLIERFVSISEAASKLKNKVGKLPSFEILTHVFLQWEKRNDLAVYFVTHKNIQAIKDCKSKMKLLKQY